MRNLIYTVFACLSTIGVLAQGVLSGKVTSFETEEGLVQAAVIIDASTGLATITDVEGNFSLELPAGDHEVTVAYIGKNDFVTNVSIQNGDTTTLNASLSDEAELIDVVVVSASKFEKKLSEETVSIEVVKSELFEENSITDMEDGMNKVPGVTVVEGQANIRGGSGWSYGAGSRVLVLVDDLPLLTADAGDAKWSSIPVENVAQVEVIKGAASALYGSSALNGIINVRTAFPKTEPYSKVVFYSGIYDVPRVEEMAWWQETNEQPFFSGMSMVHRRKINNFDLVLGGMYKGDRNYLIGASYQDVRGNFKTRYRPKGVDGLSFGVNGMLHHGWGSTFFIWNGLDSNAYQPLPNSVSAAKVNRFAIDPYVSYYDKHFNRFHFRGRYFNAKNTNNTAQGSNPTLYFGEFQYQRKFTDPGVNLIAGVSGYYADVKSPEGADSLSLVGTHYGNNISTYIQADKKFFGRLTLSAGARYEYFRIDTFESDARPVVRFGANLQVGRATYIRASYGEGYRFPTIAEKFVRTDIGGVGIYPNPNLRPETGWSAELGIKQGFAFGNWQGYIDLAGFINEYKDMMEFNFGQFAADKSFFNNFGLGFASQNVGDTRIVGGELSMALEGAIGSVPVRVIAGYTYIDPKSLNWDDDLLLFDELGDTAQPATFLPGATRDGQTTYAGTSSSTENILKYRNRHLVTSDIVVNVKALDIGANVSYRSFMENIDYIFVSPLLPSTSPELGPAFEGLAQFREHKENASFENYRAREGEAYNYRISGEVIMDIRLGYNFNENTNLTFIAKNLLNSEYTIRPAYFGPPRNYTVQFSHSF